MKKRLKAFTLVELIIVMLIMTILLAGILQLFKPVRSAYQDAAYLENKRTVCNAISKYITESLRYAQYVGVYKSSESGIGTGATGAKGAAKALLDKIYNDRVTLGLSEDDIDNLAPKIQVIGIDYSEGSDTTFNNDTHSGRLYRYKFDTSGVYSSSGNSFSTPTNFHMSFGASYYGANDFGINVIQDANKMLVVSASTQGLFGGDGAVTASNSLITSETAVILRNINDSDAKGKMYYITDTTPANGIPDILETGTLASGGNQYFFAFLPSNDMPT
ncbi:MAG: type II secretion system GspH family protein [Ruminococcus sp.]|nr:type II secretion system GspH family protein [Ruminococcus sp.]